MAFQGFYNYSNQNYIYRSVNVQAKSHFYPQNADQEKDAIEFATGKGSGFFKHVGDGSDIIIEGKEMYEERLNNSERHRVEAEAENQDLKEQIAKLTEDYVNLKTELAKEKTKPKKEEKAKE